MKKLLLKITFLAVGITICTISAFAQEQRTLAGIIKSAGNGERLPFATVLIKGTTKGTTTNVDGHFSILQAPASKLTLQITYIGFNPKEIELEAGEDMLDLAIELSDTQISLDEIVISAENYKFMNASSGISTYKVSPQQMHSLPSFGETDIFRSLQLLPGISGTNESSSGLYVRGGTPDQNLVLLDGMTVYNVDHFFGFFSAFNADAVKDVQVYKGAFPAKYGGRLSSVVDMTGKSGDQNQFHGGVSLNMLNAKAYVQVPLFSKGSFVLSARRSYTDIIQSGLYNSIFDVFNQTSANDTQTPQQGAGGGGAAGGPGGGRGGNFGGNLQGLDVATVEPDFYFYDLNSKFNFNPSDRDVISLSLYNGQDYLNESNDNSRTIDARGNQPSRRIDRGVYELNEWGNRGASLKWSRQWDARFYSNILVAYSNYFSQYNRDVNIGIYNADADTLQLARNNGTFEDNDVTDLTFRIDNEFQLNAQHKLDFGLWATESKTDYDFIRNDTLTILDRSQESWYLAAYAQDTWNPMPDLSINAGIRATYFGATEKTYVSPRLSAKYKLNDKVSFKAAYGKHYQFVNRIVNENITEGSRDFWLLADDDLLGVSSADHYIVGVSHETQDFLFDVEAYRKDLSNLSEFSLRFQRNDIDISRLFFSGTGIAQGIEFLLQKKTGKFNGWVTYTLAEVFHTFPDLNEGNSFPALHNQQHEFKLVNSFELGDWTLGLTWVYGSGKPYTEPEGYYNIELLDGREFSYTSVGTKNGSQLPAYHRMDFSAHYGFNIGKSEVDMGMSIFNLYGRKNIWYREFDFTELPPSITDIRYLGFTPNLSLSINF
ncbi:MAG: TonB-dependent receptor [Cyclobacteriaceae bacterium]